MLLAFVFLLRSVESQAWALVADTVDCGVD
ncbi:MAG: hypothetical protein ACI9SE_003062 [Neolewinella sp.]|jgi:hypothetical protein